MPSGGARLNAGRKPRTAFLVRKVLAEQILGSVNELELWQELLHSDDERVRLEALKYLTNRRDGLPAQSVEVAPKKEPSEPITCTFKFQRPDGTFQ